MSDNNSSQHTCCDHRLEEAETNLVAKQEANALLNSQVDLLTKQLKELQAGKAAYEKHFKDLSALLAKERRQKAADTKEVCCSHCIQGPAKQYGMVKISASFNEPA